MNDPKNAPIRIALIDDHTLLRETLKIILNDTPGLEIVGDAASRNESLTMIEKTQPIVVLLDICLGHDNGLELLRQLKTNSPHIKCLVLTGYAEDDFILEAIRGQADGYLMKSCTIPTLVNAIHQVTRCHKIWDESILTRLTSLHSQKGRAPQIVNFDCLSPGEKEISRLVAEGLTNSQIGHKIHLAEKTIRNRISSIMGKLYVSRRSKLAALYTENLPRTIRSAPR